MIVDADANEELVTVSLSKRLWAQEPMLFPPCADGIVKSASASTCAGVCKLQLKPRLLISQIVQGKTHSVLSSG